MFRTELTKLMAECRANARVSAQAYMRGVEKDFSDIADKLLAILATLPEDAGWRPIESAPKDRRHTLAWFPHCKCTFTVAWMDGSGWIFAGAGLIYGGEPSHWKPLPSPPAAPATGQEG